MKRVHEIRTSDDAASTRGGPDGMRVIRPISDREFQLFQALIHREVGIHLTASKKPLLVARLTKRLRELGIQSFGAYYRYVLDEDREEYVRMLDAIATNETRFFREPRQFEFLAQHILPKLRAAATTGLRPFRVRAWSTACSTGEEPYSLAMALLDGLPQSEGWQIEVHATDISTKVLDRARGAVYPVSRAADLPPRFLKQFMLKGTRSQAGMMKVAPEVRGLVTFERLNLNADSYAVAGEFDLIFCRNVLIYFDGPTKTRVIERLLNVLALEGYLFSGHAESLNGVSARVRPAGPMVYQLGDEERMERGPWVGGRR